MAMQWSGKWFRDSWVIMLEVRCSEMFASRAKGLHDALNTNQIIWQQYCENNGAPRLNFHMWPCHHFPGGKKHNLLQIGWLQGAMANEYI